MQISCTCVTSYMNYNMTIIFSYKLESQSEISYKSHLGISVSLRAICDYFSLAWSCKFQYVTLSSYSRHILLLQIPATSQKVSQKVSYQSQQQVREQYQCHKALICDQESSLTGTYFIHCINLFCYTNSSLSLTFTAALCALLPGLLHQRCYS